jgi:hypothetical protein
MRRRLLALVLAFAAAPALAAAPAELLAPMAFLAGHCWTARFPDSPRTDEHCFQWMVDDRVLRDVHFLRAPGEPDRIGETTYYANPAANRVEYLSFEDDGGFSRGAVEALPEALIFPDATYTADGEAAVVRARWTPQGDRAYEAWSETQTPDGWTTSSRLLFERAD